MKKNAILMLSMLSIAIGLLLTTTTAYAQTPQLPTQQALPQGAPPSMQSIGPNPPQGIPPIPSSLVPQLHGPATAKDTQALGQLTNDYNHISTKYRQLVGTDTSAAHVVQVLKQLVALHLAICPPTAAKLSDCLVGSHLTQPVPGGPIIALPAQ